MDPQRNAIRSRPQGAAAEMDRRRAFLQNFTPAFNIGQSPGRMRIPFPAQSPSSSGSSASMSAMSRSSSFSPVRPSRHQTVQSHSNNAAGQLRVFPNGMVMDHVEYEDFEEEEEESEVEFDEGEFNDEDVEQVVLDGVDIDEVVEESQEEAEAGQDMEGEDDEELEEEQLPHYDSRYASQDDFMFDDEELEEDYEDEGPGTSASFAPLIGRGIFSVTTTPNAPIPGAPFWPRNIQQQFLQNVPFDRRRQLQLSEMAEEEWGDDSDDEGELQILEEPSQPLTVNTYEDNSGTRRGGPAQPQRMKAMISPDICDGVRSSKPVKVKPVKQKLVYHDPEEDNSETEMAEITPTKAKLKKRITTKQQSQQANPNRIHISFTHDSSASPEKKPKFDPSQEESNEFSTNTFEEDSIDTNDTPKTSKPKEGGPRKAGRPRKVPKESNEDEDSRNLELGGDDSKTPAGEGTRRTARTRKPPRQFVVNFTGRHSTPRRGRDKESDHDSNDGDKSLTMTFKNIGDVVTRGRGSGKRGRPRGSTSRLRTHATACMENIVQEVLSKSSASLDDSDLKSEFTSETERTYTDSPVRGAKRTSRGGRRARMTKILKEKRKVSKAKPAEILDENAMMGYDKMKDEFDNSVDGESAGLGEDDTQFSNGNLSMNSAPNSNLEAITPKIKKVKGAGAAVTEIKPVTAERLFDYWWNCDGQSERFILQEQVSEFLGVTSFKRKYPDLRRRVVEIEERDFLRKEKIVTEVQCDLGLTALYFDDVIAIMRADFRSKYHELEAIWKQKLEVQKKKAEARTVARVPLVMKPEDIRKALLHSAAEWNADLNKDRQTHRNRSMDLQTFTIHEQIGHTRKFILPPEVTKMGYFPTPALVGQYVDEERVPKYSSHDLKYLPLNTPVYGPVVVNSTGDSEDSESDSDESSSTDDTSSSSDLTGKQEPSSDTDDNMSASDTCTPLVVGGEGNLGGPEAMSIICKSCNGGIANNKDSIPEMIIHCTKCKVPNHPTCLELSSDMLPFILKYNWQCTDCKNCIECNDPADEDKMLFCDLCDRGYHIYCVGLRKVPTGRWHCRVCAICYSCGVKTPSEDDRLADWHHEFKKGDKSSKFFLHSQCVNCHKLFKKGQYCPVCLKVHTIIDRKSLVECRTCEKWVHEECVKSKSTAATGTMFGFRCETCEVSFKSRVKIRTPFGSCP